MSFTTLYFGNQQEARLGPLELPLVAAPILVVPEPLRLTDLILSNRGTGPFTATVWVVPKGDAPAPANMLLGSVNLSGNDLITYNGLNIPLNQQDAIWVQANGVGLNLFGTLSRRNR